MYMKDAIRATIEIMEAPNEKIKIRSSYNLAGISFTPNEIAKEIKKHVKEFEISYKPASCKIFTFSIVISPRILIPKPGPGKGWRCNIF